MLVMAFLREYPPRESGHTSKCLSRLLTQQLRKEIEIQIVTYNYFLSRSIENGNGVKIFGVANPVRTHSNSLTWILTLNQEVVRVAANIYYQKDKQIGLIDVYDWYFIPAAMTLKNAFAIPFVCSIESLECHRTKKVETPLAMSIKGIERMGLYEAKRTRVSSKWMLKEVVREYGIPEERIVVITPTSQSWAKETWHLYDEVAGGSSSK